MDLTIKMIYVCIVFFILLIIMILMFKDLFKESNEQKQTTSILNEEYIIIRFDKNNDINVRNNSTLIKEDIIRIIQEVSKLETID